jgi:hypothetical protein
MTAATFHLGHRHSKPNCARGFLQHDGGVSLERLHQVRSSAVKTMTRSSSSSSFLHLLRVNFGVSSAISASSYLPQRKPRLNTRGSFNTLTDDAWIGIMHHVACILDEVQH